MKRVFYLIVFILFMVVETLIALYVHDDFIRPYIGDIIVVIVLYSFVRIFIPEKCRLLPLYIFIFSVAVEVMQYLKIINILGLQNNSFARVIIGSVFDLKDIACYGIGCLILALYEILRKKVLVNL